MSTPTQLDRPANRRSLPPGAGIALSLLALAPGAAVVWGLSFPGFLMASAAHVLLAVAGFVLVAVRATAWRRSPAVLAVTALVLIGGLMIALGAGQAPLRTRWAASADAFETTVANLPPVPVGSAADGYDSYPGTCPGWIGQFRIERCWTIDHGYVFLQAQDAVTDDSGIVYLPSGPGTSTFSNEDLTPLGGPWWAWTCRC